MYRAQSLTGSNALYALVDFVIAPDGGRVLTKEGADMPEVSRFFGIIVAMYFNDHPPPHFHVRYGRQRALIDIESLTVLRGKLAPRTLGLVIEWAVQHQGELMENWRRARAGHPLEAIAPLE